jgi:CRISPR-associated protein (TIGR03986 family)
VFVKKPRDIVENAGMQACTSPKCCCAACAMFGFIADGKGDSQSHASHVRFTDAICEQSDCFGGSYLLPVLSGPRLSSFEFYLSGNERNSLGPDSSNVTIAGRKFYWHAPQNVITKDDDFAKEHPKMATRMQLVKKGTEFTFSVFYDRITEDQLKKLVFALDLGENFAGSARCHKLGHGKPVGLGSVKITVDSITKRSFENGAYSVSDITEETVGTANTGMFQPTPEFNAFITKVVNLNYAAKKEVDYPRETAGGDIFTWFADNRGSLRSEGYIRLNNHLPKITDADPSLPRTPKSEQKGGFGGNRNSGYSRGGFNNRGFRR